MTFRDSPAISPLLGGVLDALPGSAVVLDPLGAVMACNTAAGGATHESIGRNIEEVFETMLPIAPNDAPNALAGIRAVLQRIQRSFTLDFASRTDAAQHWQVRATSIAVEAGGGAVLQAAPISREEADNAIARGQDASFRSIFIASLDAMLIADARGQLVASNPAARRLLAREQAAIETMSFAHLFAAALADAPVSAAEAWQALVQDGQWRGEGRVKVGESVRVLDVAASAHLTPGRHLITLRDVTESQQMEAQLRQAQKMEAIGLLTGGMAHDFNNLLTVVLANADLVLEALPDEMHELRDEVNQMIQAATHGTEMVRKLLAFSRRETLERRPVSVEAVLAETQALLTRLLPSNITVRTEAAADLPGILADPGAVQHMLLNLATNARDAMPGGGTLTMQAAHVPSVEMSNGTVRPMVTVTVEDDGHGMEKGVLARLFEPFFTTKAPGEGTGLGMAMIYGLVQQHEGTIDVTSTVGVGTRVVIGLPLAEATVQNITPRSSLLVREGATETILLVEDEEMVRRAGRRILEKHGYRVIQAANGAEALDVLRERGKEIALVVSDVVMPRMGGRELYASLRAEGFTMPFLFTSGYTDRMSSDTVALDPSVPVLPKPWTWTELTASVRAAIEEGFTA